MMLEIVKYIIYVYCRLCFIYQQMYNALLALICAFLGIFFKGHGCMFKIIK